MGRARPDPRRERLLRRGAASRPARSALLPFVIDEVGDVAGRSLVHLQCHFGLDTLSWARLGAEVTGLDFSAPAVDAARSLAAEAGIDAAFVAASLYDAPEALGGRRFDLVYTGIGALNWLPDLRRWAERRPRPAGAGRLALPGRVPPDRVGLRRRRPHGRARLLRARAARLRRPGDLRGPRGGDRATTAPRSGSTRSPSVVTAVIDAGLALELLHEHDFTVDAALAAARGARRRPARCPRVRAAAAADVLACAARLPRSVALQACPRATPSIPRPGAWAPPWWASRSSRSRRRSPATRWIAGPSASTGAPCGPWTPTASTCSSASRAT